MKKTTKILAVLTLLFCFSSFSPIELSGECDIKNIFISITPDDRDTMVITKSGDLEEVELILVPAKMETGRYKVDLTRKGSNIYKVESTKYYIETRYCYEYATYEEVILVIESSYGYNKGKIIFK